MPFTQITLTGVVELSPGVAAPYAKVALILSSLITDGVTEIAPRPVGAECDGEGNFSVVVPANNDPTTLPVGTYYNVTVTYNNTQLDSFSVIVPHASTPVDLFSLARLGNAPAPSNPYVSLFNGRNGIVQLQPGDFEAGANVSISVVGGVAEISATGGGGGGVSSVFGRTGTVSQQAGDYNVTQITNAASLVSPTFTGIVSVPFLAVSGVPGATAPSRYVGGTVSGPPASGTFAVGDFVIDQTGVVWICITAGTR